MVESIGTRPISSGTKVPRVTAPRPVAKANPAAVPDGATVALSGMAKSLAASPPIDTDRVALVRRAIERGDFPILPATIADRMIALKYDWMSADDQA